MTTPDDQPTQCAHPARSTARSSVATAIGIGPLVPVLVSQFGETRAALIVGAALIGNAVVTRVLAIPQVEAWLRAVVPLLAASKGPTR